MLFLHRVLVANDYQSHRYNHGLMFYKCSKNPQCRKREQNKNIYKNPYKIN